MDIIKKQYETNMPPYLVPRLTTNDFSSCGSLKGPSYKDGTTVVLFYTPDSRFSQDFAPELAKFSKTYSTTLNVKAAAIDLSIDSNRSLIGNSSNFPYKLGEVWPVIGIFYKGNPCSIYTGVRSAVSLSNYIIQTVGVDKPCQFKFVPCE